MARKHDDRSRAGFSLIELVAVLGVIGVLVGLSLPAVQRARESARRVECQAHLAEIGKALNAHVASIGAYPYVAFGRGIHAAKWPIDIPTADDRHYSPFLGLLPYLDQRPVYNSFNFDAFQLAPVQQHRHVPLPENTSTAAARLRIFLCPSDPAGASSPVAQWGGTSYRYNVGLTIIDAVPDGGTPTVLFQRWRGAFEPNEALTTGNFPDGLSRTVFVSEKLRSRKGSRFNPRADFWYSITWPQSQDEMIDSCSALRGMPSFYSDMAGASWLQPDRRCSAYSHDLPPNSPIPDCAVSYDDWRIADTSCITARSFHQGGVNALFGDGHVEAVGNGIGTAVWRALGTRDGHDL
jgi:prepilin-type processing-associated H-X9-DG protein/prepilin-type N-terminal cleavage/methylation domain-containing protein